MKTLCLCQSLLLCVSITLAVPFAAKAQSDDFNDGTDTPEWTRYDPLGGVGAGPKAIYTLANGTYRIQALASPNPAQLRNGRAGSLRTNVNYTDFYVQVDLVDWNETLNQAFGIIARVREQGLGATDGYAMTFDFSGGNQSGGDLDITRFTNEDPTGGGLTVTGNDRVSLVKGRKYRFVFSGKGSTFTGEVYDLADTLTPLASITGSDLNNTYPDGIIGLLVYDNTSTATGTADATFDNYRAISIVRPRIRIEKLDESNILLRVPRDETQLSPPFILESTPSLDEPITWDNMSGGVFDQGAEWLYSETSTSGNKFFRLRFP